MEFSAFAIMLIEKQKYLHMQKFLPIEAEIYAYSKTISINQRIAPDCSTVQWGPLALPAYWKDARLPH